MTDTPTPRAAGLTAVTPAVAPPEGGTPLRVTGSGFVTSGPVRSVTVGGMAVGWFRVVDDATLETFAPSGVIGATQLAVTFGTGGPVSVPFSFAVPGGSPLGDRGRWRFTLHQRAYADQPPTQTILADLVDARGRRLSQKWNTPAELTFTLDADSSQAPLVRELVTDVYGWRYDETAGADVCVFRGLVDHSEDQYDADSGVVTFVCHDYLAMLQRRVWTALYNVTGRDQDDIVFDLILNAVGMSPSSGSAFGAASYLPLMPWLANPDGTSRAAKSGRLRDRNYPGNTVHGVAFDELAHVIGGFDYDVAPMTDGSRDRVRIFYPSQGVTRAITYAYGAQLSAFTRTVASDEYANYVRMLGNNQSADQSAAQVYAEAWTSDASNVAPNGLGLWMRGEQAADVTVSTTLKQQTDGTVNIAGVIVPTYTVTLMPGVYRWGTPNMGDTIGLVIDAGRLNVNTTVRVVGIDYDLGDDGDEDVKLTLGRSPLTLHDLLVAARVDIDALARR